MPACTVDIVRRQRVDRTPERDDGGDDELSEYGRFEELTRRLVAVPKREVDEARDRATRNGSS